MGDYELELNRLRNDIETIKKGKIYEIDKTSGNPSYYNIGTRMEHELNDLMYKIEKNKN